MRPRQQRFCDFYITSLNGTQSAINAGYSERSAGSTATELLSNPSIASYISKRRDQAARRADLTSDMIVKELRKIGFANMEDYTTVDRDGSLLPEFTSVERDEMAAVSEFTVEEFKDGRSDKREVRRTKFKLHDKANALIALGKHLGMFKDVVEIDFSDPAKRMLRELAASVIRPIEEPPAALSGPATIEGFAVREEPGDRIDSNQFKSNKSDSNPGSTL